MDAPVTVAVITAARNHMGSDFAGRIRRMAVLALRVIASASKYADTIALIGREKKVCLSAPYA